MSNDHVHPTFRSLLSDIREATQTLANCAAKGALQKDGTRAMPVKYIKDIRLTFEQPPISDRRYDWRAMHDGDDEEPSRHGWGSTPEEALADLKLVDDEWEDLQTEKEKYDEEEFHTEEEYSLNDLQTDEEHYALDNMRTEKEQRVLDESLQTEEQRLLEEYP